MRSSASARLGAIVAAILALQMSSALAQTRPSLQAIRREILPDALRVTLVIEREIAFREERLDGPPRVFIDLKGVSAASPLRDAALAFPDDVVRRVRVGRPQSDTTRVVFDLQGAARHSVYVLYNPYRIVIDFERVATPLDSARGALSDSRRAKATTTEATKSTKTIATKDTKVTKTEAAKTETTKVTKVTKVTSVEPGAEWTLDPLPSRRIVIPPLPAPPASAATATTTTAAPAAPPIAPATNMKGGFSLSRQLGLGISRIVIDPGHGGHDPGARIKGLSEADLVLDVALRLEKLLLAQPGVNVILTRRSNVYVPLEQRTGIANRDEADLFLSIHANASENDKARGVETYFLNFAPNPAAEQIAARENSGGSKTMHSLPDIVKAIALNNKIDESRDFAALVQAAMFERLKKANKEVKDLGVKQAPFMVLVGATMPSILAEIAFVTNKQEAALLKTPGYRRQIAEALLNGIMRYQKAVKATQTVASQR